MRYIGAVYIYFLEGLANTWSEIDRLVPQTIQAGDHFGYALDLSEEHLVIGAYNAANPVSQVPNAGSIYVFKYSSISKLPKFNLEDQFFGQERNDYFGFSVSTDMNVIVVGAPGSLNREKTVNTGAK